MFYATNSVRSSRVTVSASTFADQQVDAHPDGSATVTARITDLFDARRILLSYGENCTVLEPPALVEQMRKVATEFSKKYLTPEE